MYRTGVFKDQTHNYLYAIVTTEVIIVNVKVSELQSSDSISRKVKPEQTVRLWSVFLVGLSKTRCLNVSWKIAGCKLKTTLCK